MGELVGKLACLSSFEAIRYCLTDFELHDLQCVDVMRMLASKRAIVSYNTGLGKTVLAAAVMRLLWNENPARKFIFIGTLDQIVQTPEKLERMCGRRVISSFSSEDSINKLLLSEYENYSILFITHDTLRKDKIMNDLFKHRKEYCGLFIDEAHELSNVGVAKTASILSGMCRQFEYCFALTATPITTSVMQMAKLASVVDNQTFGDAGRLERNLRSGRVTIEDYPGFFINRTREDFGSQTDYHGIVEFVQPLPHQKAECGGSALFQLCKGNGAYPQAEALVRLIKERSGKRGLVYVNQHSVRDWILPFFAEAGIRYECINGETSSAARRKIMHRFNELHDVDVVVTAVTSAIDLDCDYVIFYEFTVDIKQMIGRAHRGLGSKTLDVIFVITEDSSEIDYFYKNIYQISMVIKTILKHDYTEVEQIDSELRQNVKD